ncbi:ribosome production factor 2 homolog [Exaiptasia diaphana]|uniref:Ribosome production factor 2 homolog n=1 Tax=Exaiptasia diaphana TaxID=2652724 RepID=A0A913Y4S9_EXADI|nr:ribosome production factor 2 homolog [Exaiptasia diaphana]KXJ22791.1 Ribosome production factor 2-like [Exaiptasia diaphana]
MADGKVVKAKTQRGKRAIEAKSPKAVENTKKALFIRGGRTSELVTQALKDLYALKKPNAVMFQRKNVLLPFEDQTSLEFFSVKNDASLIAYGSHSKKRPHNLVLGRTFDGHVLDLIELGIDRFKTLQSFQTSKCTVGTKPCLLFSGELFETELEYKRLKNLLIDFFRGTVTDKIRLQGLEHVIQITAIDKHVLFRSYRTILKKSGGRTPRVELEEMGPAFDFTLRRTRLASEDLMKEATKVPKVAKPTKVKNVDYDAFGTKTGRVHMTRQDYGKLQTRKLKGLKRGQQDENTEEDTMNNNKRTKT